METNNLLLIGGGLAVAAYLGVFKKKAIKRRVKTYLQKRAVRRVSRPVKRRKTTKRR